MEAMKTKGRTQGRNSTELMMTVDVETITSPSKARGKAGNPCAGACSWLWSHQLIVACIVILCLLLVAAGVLAGVFGALRANMSDDKIPSASGGFEGCGWRPEAGTRIVNGEKSTLAWPWQVSLQNKFHTGKWTHFCGASIISSTWLLTARHCITNVPNLTGDIIAVMGTNSLNDTSLAVQRVAIAETVLHPDGESSDVALLRLAWSVAFSATVGPVCLPVNATTAKPDTPCFVTGWGVVTTNDKTKQVDLREVKLTIMNDSSCEPTNSGRPLQRSMMCAADVNTHADTCQGDSGGPLVRLAGEAEPAPGRWVLEGITSFGRGCGSRVFLGVYARVAAFTQWISRTTATKTTAATETTAAATTTTGKSAR
ncbi:chymotrypsinogen A-like [Petromyzon marinus]|uniref:chymotrypsinogen A-like n=1 Tax=Petromyzon marinus TaxID=7757 RepID=UPI003F70075F